MDTQLKAKWIEALRSGKFDQVRGALYDPGDGYCCLGVLCSTLGASFYRDVEHSIYAPWLDGRRLDAGNGDEYLHVSFLESAGFGNSVQHELAKMNDDGKSFAEIADYIEINL